MDRFVYPSLLAQISPSASVNELKGEVSEIRPVLQYNIVIRVHGMMAFRIMCVIRAAAL